MIRFSAVSKSFPCRGGRKTVLDSVDAVFPSRRSVALLGRNGAGKSTLLQLVAGTMHPTSGRIVSTGAISWPVGFAGSFHGELTGAQNTRFVARIHGVDSDDLVAFVEDFAELGKYFRQPFRSYSAGMKSRLAFGVSMGIAFDTYLVDEIMSVGDAAFREKSTALFRARMANAGAIVVSHSMGQLRDMCNAGAVLENGGLICYDDVEPAIDRHLFNMRAG